MNLHLLGIRHHGVGSAQNVLARLQQLRPDLILIEGPPELTDILHWVAHRHLVPPVAVLAYNADNPKQASFYPFAEYSPEWVATKWAFEQNIPVRTLDLPLMHGFALEGVEKSEEKVESGGNGSVEIAPEDAKTETQDLGEPLEALARAAGYANYHNWWEVQFEQSFSETQAQEHFEAVLLAMTAARENKPNPAENALREAFMRREMRQAHQEGHQNVAVVCGAWHAPALQDWHNTQQTDEALTKNLPKVRVRTTWIPWTNERLGWWSGYGAGIQSPGWYEHRWHRPHDNGVEWLTGVARLFRENKMDISTAHVIEAFRLAEALATLRGQSRAGLAELNEATQAVLCMGEPVLLKLVAQELTVAYRMGSVPDELPKLPIQADFDGIAKKLRLEVSETSKEIELDLRKENDLARSVFLHRLGVLEINWGQRMRVSNKGTFKEGWTLKWQPEWLLKLIEKAIWGNRVEDAANAFVAHQAQQATSLDTLSKLLEAAIPAELFGVLGQLLHQINELATVAADIQELMAALLPLVNVSRYGNVRKTDLSAVNQVVESLVARVCVGLPTACYGLDDESAARLLERIKQTDEAIRLIENPALSHAWQQALQIIADKPTLSPVLLGGSTRLLFDHQALTEAETEQRFGLALSLGQTPAHSAGWLEGFLKGNSLIMLYDENLWLLLYRWVAALNDESFLQLLPVLRRTFSAFEPAERRQLGQKAKRQQTQPQAINHQQSTAHFDTQTAERSLTIIQTLLGI
jgi:Family of unknown function (DUF5682)